MTKKEKKEMDILAEDNSLLIYLQDINRIPLLSKEEEEKTARMAANGNKAACDKLISANLRFVIMIAKKYQGRGLPLEDLIGEGNIGLINAVKHYDAGRGFRFITYAVWWVRQAIIKALQEKARMIRLPGNKANELKMIEQARLDMQGEHGHKKEPEIREVAALLDIEPDRAVELINISQDVISLDDPVAYYENTLTLKDLIEDESHNSPVENALNSILKDDVEAALSKLGSRAAEVLRSRFGLGGNTAMTLREIGDRFNMSREWIRQIEKRALGQMAHSAHHKKLEGYIA